MICHLAQRSNKEKALTPCLCPSPDPIPPLIAGQIPLRYHGKAPPPEHDCPERPLLLDRDMPQAHQLEQSEESGHHFAARGLSGEQFLKAQLLLHR